MNAIRRITWVNPVFLDYRVPVYKALHDLCEEGLTIVYSANRTPARVRQKIESLLGRRAMALDGERSLIFGRGNEFANRSFTLPYQPNLNRAIHASRPEVIIAEGFFQWTTAALWLRLTRGIPLVIAYERTAHTERHANRLRTRYRRLVCRFTDAICCNGRLSKEYCTNVLGFSAESVVTGAMAADTDGLERQLRATPPAAIEEVRRTRRLVAPVFLFVGRLIAPKGISELIEGWAVHVRRLGQRAGTLLIVGDGPEKPALESLTRRHGLEMVHFVGSVDYDHIAPYYAVADVFVMPTLEDNWSLVVPEAMACGLPILCSVYNGCWPELVRPENGRVFDPLKPDDIAQALSWSVEHRGELRAMGETSRRIVAGFSPQEAAGAVFEACRIAFERRPSLEPRFSKDPRRLA